MSKFKSVLVCFALVFTSLVGSAHAATSAVTEIRGGYTLLTESAVASNQSVKLGNLLFYVGVDSEHGAELWRTDGTVLGTQMVADLTPGRASTDLLEIFAVGGKVWLSQWGGGAWVSDGTARGTKKISDSLVIEGVVEHPSQPGVVLLNAGPTDADNAELYRSAGTRASTSLVGGAEINPGSAGSGPHNFAELNGYQYFVASNSFGFRLMRTDGSLVEVVDELNQPPTINWFTKPLAVGEEIVFIATDGKVWSWNGVAFDEKASWNAPMEPFEADNALYATVQESAQFKLYRYSSAGILNLSNIVGEDIQIRSGHTVVKDDQEIFFFTTVNSGDTTSLWMVNSRGSVPVELGTFPFYAYDFTISGIEIASNGRVYLSSSVFGSGLRTYWVPIAGGEPTRVDVNADDRTLTFAGIPLKIVRGSLVSSFIHPAYGTIPVKIAPSGSSALTILATNDSPRAERISPYGEFNQAVIGNTLYFTAYDAAHGIELWKYEKGATSARLVKDIWPGVESSRPWDLMTANGKLYFIAETEDHGIEPWISDGTAAGTRLIVDANISGPSWPEFRKVGNRTYFKATDASGAEVLYRTDGTQSGLKLIPSNPLGLQYGQIEFLGVYGGALFLLGTLGNRSAIFKATNRSGRTREVFSLGDEYPDIDEMAAVGNKFVFLLQSDSSTGLYAVEKSFGPAPVDLNVPELAYTRFFGVVNGKLVFKKYATDDAASETLWATDGRPAGTTMVKDLDPSSLEVDGSDPLGVTLGKRMLFLGVTENSGLELWVTDATSGGTKMVREIAAGAQSGLSFFSNVTKVRKRAYFEAPNPKGQIVLWGTNGTASGTSMVANGITDVRVVDGFTDSLVIAGTKRGNQARLYFQSLHS